MVSHRGDSDTPSSPSRAVILPRPLCVGLLLRRSCLITVLQPRLPILVYVLFIGGAGLLLCKRAASSGSTRSSASQACARTELSTSGVALRTEDCSHANWPTHTCLRSHSSFGSAWPVEVRARAAAHASMAPYCIPRASFKKFEHSQPQACRGVTFLLFSFRQLSRF